MARHFWDKERTESEGLVFGTFGWIELLLILTIVLVVYGAGKLPQLGEAFGRAIHGFKRTMREAETPPPTSEEPSKLDSKQDARNSSLPFENHRYHS